MAGNAPVFPAFLKLEHQRDGSARSSFMAEVDSMLGDAENRFKRFGDTAAKFLDNAASFGRTSTGGLDIGAGKMREAAAAAEMRAKAAREIATATIAAARAEGDYSQQARLAIAAANAQAVAEEQAAKAARERAVAAGQLQAALDRQVHANDNITQSIVRQNAAHGPISSSNDQMRAGLQQLAYQLNDVSTMWAMGARPMQIFASQAGQVTQAIGLMSAGGRGLAGFLGGPWGIAIMSAITVTASLGSTLLSTSDATKQVEFASYALSDAQGILGGVMDLTTGKINTQSQALLALARAQAIAGRIQAQARAADARQQVADMQGKRMTAPGTSMMGGSIFPRWERKMEGQVSSQLLNGVLTGEEAVSKLEQMQAAGLITKEVFLEAAQAVANLGVEMENVKVFSELEKALNGDKQAVSQFLKPDTRKPKKGGADKAAAKAERLKEFGASSVENITRLTERFDDQPKLIDQVAQATRELNAVMDELAKKQPPDFEAMINQAQAAKKVVADALTRPFEEYIEDSAQAEQLQRLRLAGREDEAEMMQVIFRMEQRLGSEEQLRQKVQQLTLAEKHEEAAVYQRVLDQYPEMRSEIMKQIALQKQLNEVHEKRQEILNAYMESISSVRGDLEGLLTGDLGGGSFLKSLKNNFKQLQGRLQTEQLFGAPLRALEEQIRKSTGIQSSMDVMRSGMENAGEKADALATVFERVAARIDGAAMAGIGGGMSGPTNAHGIVTASSEQLSTILAVLNGENPANDNSGEIVVTANKRTAEATAKMSMGVTAMRPEEYAVLLGKVITKPLADALATLGLDLSGTLAGAMGGNMVGGIPGAIVGGLKGFMGDFGSQIFGEGAAAEIGKALDGAMKGIQTGTQMAGMMKMLGIKTSTTGAQIGGAIGSFIPIPGGQIIGSIAGGLIGGLFKKTKRGEATISGGSGGFNISTEGNSGSREKAAGEAANAVTQSLENIAKELGASIDYSLGAVSVSLRKKDWRVDATGQSISKISNGAIDFGDDQEAAIAYAVKNLIEDGVLTGIRASTLNILKAGDDLEAAIQKALDFENVFTELKRYKNPVGAAIDELNKEFEKLITLFGEANATTEEWAQLEELYGIKRAEAIKQASEAMISSLQDLYDFLSYGDSGLSLRDRDKELRSRYSDLKTRVERGDTSAFDEYSQVGRELLDVERQLYGSTQAYFDLHAEMRATTQATLDRQKALANAAANSDNPFSASSVPVTDNVGVVTAIDNLSTAMATNLGYKLDAVNLNLGTVTQRLNSLITLQQQISVSGGSW